MRKKKVRSKFLIVIPFQEVSFRWNNRGANIYVPLSLSASKLTCESRFTFPHFHIFPQVQALRLFSKIETIFKSNIKNHMSFLWWLKTSQSLVLALMPIPDTHTKSGFWSWDQNEAYTQSLGLGRSLKYAAPPNTLLETQTDIPTT